jgi:pilus assembly protein FimV
MALLGMAATADVGALGFGRVPSVVPYGAPLDLSIPIRLEAGESLAPTCVFADVSIGDRRLPASAVRVSLEGHGTAAEGHSVRVRTSLAVEEPVVTLDVAAGCDARVTRRVVVLADPPARIALSSAAPAAQRESDRPDAAPGPIAARQQPATTAGAQPAPDRPSTVPVSYPVARGTIRQPASTTSGRPAADVTTPLPAPQREDIPPAPRALTLAAQDEAEARAAAVAAQAEASAATQRVAALEQGMQDLHSHALSNQEALAQMRSRLGDAEGRSRLLPALLLLCAMLILLAAWLAQRLRTLQRAAPSTAHAAAGNDAPLDGSRVGPESDGQHGSASAKNDGKTSSAFGALPSAADAVWRASTEPLMADAPADDRLVRPATVDEIMDLEQQAEFFILLGQDDAAIDLWVAHLRSSGGVSPLPYLKLLEIHKRRHDRPAYERTRTRFSQRFDAPAPDWDAEPEQGQALQDYPRAMSRLQRTWHVPQDAMLELEGLLLRKNVEESFDLPAYRDALVLYAVARELQKSGHDGVEVDLVLPLTHEQDLAVAPGRAGPGAAAQPLGEGSVVLEGRAIVPVDLDLSDSMLPGDSLSATLSPLAASWRRD